MAPIQVSMRAAAATLAVLGLLVASFTGGASASSAGNPEVAALQVGLRAHGFYAGTVDGVLGPGTQQAVMRFQRRAGLPPTGVIGPSTRKAFGRYGRRSPLGVRDLAIGSRGWDVAALQFALAWHGFPSAAFNGVLGAHTDTALRKFQVWAGLTPDGVAGPSTYAALRAPVPRAPFRLTSPLAGPLGDLFGPRGNRFHAGIDIPAPKGTPVGAAAPGRVVFAAPAAGFGKLVVVEHRNGVRTRYAHLSRIEVRFGQYVKARATVGLVGATGEAAGPHLHFEVLVRGANVDPLSAL
jgi:peptidoglycan hydrolase-like protein with peptidoglycan-binding domain